MRLKSYDIIALYSGGLDSRLACKLLANQNISVLAVKFLHPFSPGIARLSNRLYTDNNLGVDVIEVPTDDEYLSLIRNPKYGYGSCANPCLDCKAHFFRRAWRIAQQVGASGIATGEVIGQRPFSQRREAMKLIEKEAGVQGKVVRPLCAKLCEPSEPEKQGIVNRTKLLDIKGRSRKRQMELAEKLGITDYPSPAGGCLLTDPGYSARLFDAMQYDEFSFEMTQLLKFGRHFRIDGVRIVVGRNESENKILEEHFSRRRYLLVPADITGPSALVDLCTDEKVIQTAAEIVARYISSVKANETVKISVILDENNVETICASPANQMWLEQFLISAK